MSAATAAKPMTRQEALASGATQYFTGKPCKHGHVAPRRTAKGDCVKCVGQVSIRWAVANKSKASDSRQKWLSTTGAGYYRDWYAKNADDRRADSCRYKRENPEMRRKHDIARRARLANAEGHYTVDDIARITKAQGGKCACCRRRRKLTIDHIVALTNGGSNWPSNLQMLCKSCNSSKQARDNIEFMQSMGMLL